MPTERLAAAMRWPAGFARGHEAAMGQHGDVSASTRLAEDAGDLRMTGLRPHPHAVGVMRTQVRVVGESEVDAAGNRRP